MRCRAACELLYLDAMWRGSCCADTIWPMVGQLDIDDFLAAAGTRTIADVRSPAEFAAGHIPGAVSLPLFSDEERARVGICYKEQGHDAAVLLGLEIVGPKMRALAEQTLAASNGEAPLIHCWRGGMRSQSMSWLTQQVGLDASILSGGYKSFRRAAHADFARPRRIIVLSGMTGAGKTTLLRELADAGEQIIDLEGLANHRGSSFGGLGLPPQPTVEQFENDLYIQLRELDADRVVWFEDESPSIGKVRVPHELWSVMRDSPAIFVDVDRETRAKNLAEEYGELDSEGLEAATRRLERRLGNQRMNEVLGCLEAGDMFRVAYGLLEYYDKTYRHAATRKPRSHVYPMSGNITVERLIEFSREQCVVN